MFDGIINLMTLSKLWEMVKDSKTWNTVVHGVSQSDTAQQLNNSKLQGSIFRLEINLGLVVDGGGMR